MYGQGSYAPQFWQGPPFPQAPPPPYQQALPGPPPPPVYQHGPPPPHPSQMSVGQPYMHQLRPVHGSAPMAPSYPQPGPPYPSPMPSQNAHHVPQPMPPLPRMLQPPPMPPSQGQVLYRTPPPPPPGIQHVPTPPPPPPSSFISITPAPFASFVPAGDAQPPLPPSSPPPPPLPPSSPPPLPPPPPPSTSPEADLPGIVPKEQFTEPMDNVEAPVAPAHSTKNVPTHGDNPHGEAGDVEKMSALAEGKEPSGLPSPPPKPVEEVVRNIEVLCKFIEEVGPHFENYARTKEAGNPHFDFLFGGEPGSAAAIGHEYFQWVKRKYQFETKSLEDSQQNVPSSRPSDMDGSSQSGNLEDEGAAASPAVSDMDMEDDVSPDGDEGFDDLSKESTREPMSGSSEVDLVNVPLHALQSTTEQLESVLAVSGTISCSGSLPSLQDGEDDKDSPFIEDISPVGAPPDSAECVLEDYVHGSVGTPPGDSNLVMVFPTAAGGKVEEIPRVFVKDRSPFRLIQGYASDDSEEDDKRENAEDICPDRVSPTVNSNITTQNASWTEVGSALPTNSGQPVTSAVPKEVEFCAGSSPHKSASPNDIHYSPVDLSDEKKLDDSTGTSKLPQDNKIMVDDSNDFDQVEKFNHEEDVKQDTAMLDVDEFGRLVRKGASDSDSDGMHYNERRGKRGRSWSRSRSPQESRWRRRSRSPRRRGKQSQSPSWSPGRNSSKSPPAFRRTNVFARRDRDQPPECFNFIRGRCFRGASCRFLHRDFDRHRNRQQQYQEYPQDSGNYGVHDDVLVSENSYIDKIVVTKMGLEECNNIPLKEDKSPETQACKELSEATVKTIKGAVLDETDESEPIIKDAQPAVKKDFSEMQVTDQVSQEVISQIQEPQQVEILLEASNVSPIEEDKTHPLPDSSHPLQADSLPIQSSPAGKTQPLLNETLVEQPISGEGISFHPSQPNSVSTSTSEQPQNVSQYAHVEGHVLHPSLVQAIQSTTFQNQTPEAQPYLAHAPVTLGYPSQSTMTQAYSNYAPTNQRSEQSLLPKEFPQPSLSAPSSNIQPSQLLPPAPHGHPPPLFPLNNTSLPFASVHPRENLLLPVTSHQPQHPPSHAFPSHGPPITSDYNHQRVPPPNPAWANLPPPPPSHVSALPSRPAFPPMDSQFQQNALPPRSDFNPAMRSIPPGELPHTQVVNFRPFHSAESSHQPPLHIDEFKQMPLPARNQQDQPFVRDDRFPHPPMPGSQIILDSQGDYHLRRQPFLREDARTPLPSQGFNSSSPFAQGGIMHSQSLPFPREPLPNNPYSIPEDRLPPTFLPREQFPNVRNLPHQPPYGQQHPASSNFPSNFSTPGTVDISITRYSSSFPDNNLPPHLSYTGVPKMPISTHYNPYASTFEQTPASVKFGPIVPGRENDMNYSNRYDSSVNSGHVPVGGPGSRITASPPNSRISSEQFMPRTGVYPHETPAEVLPDVQKQSVRDSAAGDAYDPLFDSIEPSSHAFKKVDHVKENPAIHDVEKSSQKGGVTAEPKSEADEFGEVATDAEVGAVENGSPLLVDGKDWSPGVPADVGNTAAGEIEIDQVRSPGKSKKSKDSRSMKLFKIALADFVKEVLKPSWRQGNMSKEAFKTIVKKTVEKVSGAMPNHQIPKTQVKINQYVESSQRKLTKLVMGYVDKYVKM